MTSRLVILRGGLRRLMEGNSRSVASSLRYFSESKGCILSEEERAKETIYIQKMEREKMEKLKKKAKKEKAAKEKDDKNMDADFISATMGKLDIGESSSSFKKKPVIIIVIGMAESQVWWNVDRANFLLSGGMLIEKKRRQYQSIVACPPFKEIAMHS
ncbi:hypothetical protein ACS0TY_005735 [Phlomoides rotata]